jgi:hypothetical protein
MSLISILLVLIVTGLFFGYILMYRWIHNKERIQFTGHNCDNHMGS